MICRKDGAAVKVCVGLATDSQAGMIGIAKPNFPMPNVLDFDSRSQSSDMSSKGPMLC